MARNSGSRDRETNAKRRAVPRRIVPRRGAPVRKEAAASRAHLPSVLRIVHVAIVCYARWRQTLANNRAPRELPARRAHKHKSKKKKKAHAWATYRIAWASECCAPVELLIVYTIFCDLSRENFIFSEKFCSFLGLSKNSSSMIVKRHGKGVSFT